MADKKKKPGEAPRYKRKKMPIKRKRTGPVHLKKSLANMPAIPSALGPITIHPGEKESPILIHGTLHCPHCKTPITTEEIGENKYRCVYCTRLVGKLSDEVILEMARNVPIEMFREWNREFSSKPYAQGTNAEK